MKTALYIYIYIIYKCLFLVAATYVVSSGDVTENGGSRGKAQADKASSKYT